MATVAYDTITDSSPVRNYVTVQEIKDWIDSIDPNAVDWDNNIYFETEDLEELAQEWAIWVEEETSRFFFEFTRTVRVDGSGALLLELPDHPVTTLTTAEYVYPIAGNDVSETTIDTSFIILDNRGDTSLLRTNSRWAHGQRNVRVAYTAGDSSVPKWIRRMNRIGAAIDILTRVQGGSGTGAWVRAGPVEIHQGTLSRLGPNGVPLAGEWVRCLQKLRDYENIVVQVAKGYIPDEPATNLQTARQRGDARV